MKDGFLRVATVTPNLRVADCQYNVHQILKEIAALPQDTAIAVFPELCITGYTCDDLFLQNALLNGAKEALAYLLQSTANIDTVIVVGLPIADGAATYNCAAVLQRGKLLGLVPKCNLPNHGEFHEARLFTAGEKTPRAFSFAGQQTILSAQMIFRCAEMPLFTFGVEICEDVWVANAPSHTLAAAGATIICNLSASNAVVGKREYLRDLVRIQSAKLRCAYLLCNAGIGESSTDLVFAGGNIIAEGGKILAQAAPFANGAVCTELDLQRLEYDRRKSTTFTQTSDVQTVSFSYPLCTLSLTRSFSAYPFVPDDVTARADRAEEILQMQAAGLAKRLQHTGADAVIGLSGGLDSALALLVTVRAYTQLNKNPKDITTVTMPCFGTTGRTLQNARALACAAGTTLREIEIAKSVKQHLADIAHDENTLDITYENAQARERTQVLMDIANSSGALVIGTGDLSELALGWATYNGDHMSMYGVNADIPKTLVRCLVSYESKRLGGLLGEALRDILDTPVSPELLPPKDGVISQETEQLVGPYILHDFFLFYMLRYGFSPKKIYRLALYTFADTFTPAVIKKWLQTFVRRFFNQQFKRSCLPDGPKIGSVSLSPRGDWHMPSDASSKLWMAELETLE